MATPNFPDVAALSKGVEQVEASVKAGRETFVKAVKASQDAAKKAYKTSADAITKGYDQSLATAKEQVAKSFPEATVKFDEAAGYSKDAIDAVFAAGAIASKGIETLGAEVTAVGEKSLDASFATAKALFGCKTFKDVTDLQAEFVRSQLDAMFANTTKLSEMAMKVASETFEPIQTRVTKTMEKFTKPMSA
ncbi:MAG: phasin family protein [Alphaproteobacteria bacterium]